MAESAENSNTTTTAADIKPEKTAAELEQAAAEKERNLIHRARQLKIKAGIVKRFTKDKVVYLKEAEDQKKKIEKFTEEGREPLFLRQQVESLRETERMLPDVARQIQSAYYVLEDLLRIEKKELADTEEYKEAVQILKDAEPHFTRTEVSE